MQGPGSEAFFADFRAADWLLPALRGVSCRPVQQRAAQTFPTKRAQIPSSVTEFFAAFSPNPWLTFAGLLLRLSFLPLPIKLKGLSRQLSPIETHKATKQLRAPQRTGPKVNLAE